MREVTVTICSPGQANEFIRVEWPSSTPGLLAEVSAGAIGKSIYARIMSGLTPPGNRIFFSVGSPLLFEHENMKVELKKRGLQFEERIETLGEVKVGLLRRRKISKRTGMLWGSTDRAEILEIMFHTYMSWYGLSWPFAFVIAEVEPPTLRDFFVGLIPSDKTKVIPANLVMNSHCVLMTHFEHGLVLVTNKISLGEVIEVARQVANLHRKDLIVRYSVANAGQR